MRKFLMSALVALPLMTGGCVSTVASIVTAPVKMAGKGVDWATTSQDEADRNYGRKMRKEEAREGRDRKKAAERCRDNREDCGNYDGYRADRDD